MLNEECHFLKGEFVETSVAILFTFKALIKFNFATFHEGKNPNLIPASAEKTKRFKIEFPAVSM